MSSHDVSQFLGNWACDESSLTDIRSKFAAAIPFPHVTIPNFFCDAVAQAIAKNFPVPRGEHVSDWKAEGWHVYDNPIEGKLSMSDITTMAAHDPIFESIWVVLQSDEMISLIKRISSINNLEPDPNLHGAGLHYHPSGGKLEMHLDYSINPISGKERRVSAHTKHANNTHADNTDANTGEFDRLHEPQLEGRMGWPTEHLQWHPRRNDNISHQNTTRLQHCCPILHIRRQLARVPRSTPMPTERGPKERGHLLCL